MRSRGRAVYCWMEMQTKVSRVCRKTVVGTWSNSGIVQFSVWKERETTGMGQCGGSLRKPPGASRAMCQNSQVRERGTSTGHCALGTGHWALQQSLGWAQPGQGLGQTQPGSARLNQSGQTKVLRGHSTTAVNTIDRNRPVSVRELGQ